MCGKEERSSGTLAWRDGEQQKSHVEGQEGKKREGAKVFKKVGDC